MGQTRFRDARGVEWRVCEVTPRQLARLPAHRRVLPELRAGWLCFESAREKRRLARYPADWSALDDAELAGLCARAAPAPAWPVGAAAAPSRPDPAWRLPMRDLVPTAEPRPRPREE